jgi:hypothetical protein
MKRKALALTLIVALLASARITVVKEAKANFVSPPAKTVMTIETPQNITYNANTITLHFTVETNWAVPYFYSLDGQEWKPIDNITTVSKELLPDWERWWDGQTPIYRKTLVGTCVLSNLSEGGHDLTVYQIYIRYPDQTPQDGNLVHSANVQFSVGDKANIPESPSSQVTTKLSETQPELFPIELALGAFGAHMVIVSIGLLVYFKKRRR